jgi:hypothetical protein
MVPKDAILTAYLGFILLMSELAASPGGNQLCGMYTSTYTVLVQPR